MTARIECDGTHGESFLILGGSSWHVTAIDKKNDRMLQRDYCTKCFLHFLEDMHANPEKYDSVHITRTEVAPPAFVPPF